MVNLNNIKPNKNFSTIHHLLELMEFYNWDKPKLAKKLGMSKAEMKALFDDDLPIAEKEARAFEIVFGISHKFWLNLDENYRTHKVK